MKKKVPRGSAGMIMPEYRCWVTPFFADEPVVRESHGEEVVKNRLYKTVKQEDPRRYLRVIF